MTVISDFLTDMHWTSEKAWHGGLKLLEPLAETEESSAQSIDTKLFRVLS